MRRVIEMTFAAENVDVTTVNSGEAAVAKADDIRPDLVLADLSMPGMDGYAVATEIKNKPGLAKTAVVVLASKKTPFDEAKGKAAGVDDHVLKPFDTQHIIDRLKQVLAAPRAAATDRAARPAAAAPAAGGRPASKTATMAYDGQPATAKPRPVAAAAQKPAQAAATAQHAAPPPAEPVKAEPRQSVETKTLAESAPMPAAEPTKPAAAKPAAEPTKLEPAAAEPAAAEPAKDGDLAAKLDGMGLEPEQVQGVLALTHDVIEKVVWEVVPDLAEAIIREEIKRLTSN
jgi:CheY-like chemotaxis protein